MLLMKNIEHFGIGQMRSVPMIPQKNTGSYIEKLWGGTKLIFQ